MKKNLRKIRHVRVRRKLKGTVQRLRLCVFRSGKHIYAQVVNDEKANTLAAASTLDKEFKQKGIKSTNKDAAFLVGKMIADKAKKAGVSKVCFDRGGYKFHGKVKRLSEGAKEGGLIF
ncbi:MAG: 50S ribosomal protein L18 [Candidatus Omnitrophica bacterium]|nr:50S ribosomal protein L18 [Candidatus Omnitrophota bacterium]